MDGKLHVYKRERSSVWQCSTFLGGINYRASTKEKNLSLAKEFALDWYMERYGEYRRRKRGLPILSDGTDRPTTFVHEVLPEGQRRRTPTGPTFEEAAKAFYDEYRVATQGERNERYVKQKGDQLRLYLFPFFGKMRVTEITAGLIQKYRTHRHSSKVNPETGEVIRPSRSTLHSEMVTLRQVLKSANRHGWISALPDMTVAYKASGKISHRAWFRRPNTKCSMRPRANGQRIQKENAFVPPASSFMITCSSWGTLDCVPTKRRDSKRGM
jgi:hypothetical protein